MGWKGNSGKCAYPAACTCQQDELLQWWNSLCTEDIFCSWDRWESSASTPAQNRSKLKWVGFSCHGGSEFLIPAYLEPCGEGRKQVRYPSSLGSCDSVQELYKATRTGLQPSWSPSAPLWWHVGTLKASCLGMRWAVSWKALLISRVYEICIKGLCWKCQKVTKLRSTCSAWQKPALTL